MHVPVWLGDAPGSGGRGEAAAPDARRLRARPARTAAARRATRGGPLVDAPRRVDTDERLHREGPRDGGRTARASRGARACRNRPAAGRRAAARAEGASPAVPPAELKAR